MVVFRVLGAFEVADADWPVKLGAPRQRSVLGRLLVARGQVVSVGQMINDLWDRRPPASAAASVHVYVSNLRRALEPDRTAGMPPRTLVTASPGYALRGVEVDAWRFEDMAREGTALLSRGNTRAALHRLDEALGLWRGPAYSEFASAGWALSEIGRLDELHATAIEQRAAAVITLGASGTVVADLRAHLAEHPLREEGWRLLAVALYHQGRQGDALDALRQARHLLAEELGVDPSPALRQLEADILAQSPEIARPAVADEPLERATSLVARPVPVAPSQAWIAAGRMVGDRIFGRERELTLLLAASRGIVLISGEAGIGKTTLAEAAAAEHGRSGRRVAIGRCPEIGGAPAGWAWVEILRTLTAYVAPSDGVAAQIQRLLDDVVAPDPVRGDRDMAAERFRLRRGLRVYLADAARVAPLLLVIDDLHRADEETLATLVDLAAELRNARILVVGTFRDEESGPLAEALATLARHEPLRIVLSGLGQSAADDLLAAVSGVAVTPGTIAAMVDRTGGNPFFLREAARLIAAEGETAALSTVPAGVRDVLRRRFARLAAPIRGVLRNAAVIGRDFDVDVLIEVNGDGEDVVVEAVEAALAAGLLVEPENGDLRFTHMLTRDTLYDDMSRLRQVRTHVRVAESLERLRPHDVTALAHHFAAGRKPEKAARYCVLAAEQAERRFAYHEAASLWERAAEVGDGEDLELLMRQVRALALCNDLVTARKLREQAIRLALPQGDPKLTTRVIGAFDVPTMWSTRDYNEGSHEVSQIIERTLSQLPSGDRAARCSLLISLAFELTGEETSRGIEAAEEALEIARTLDDPEALAGALNARHLHTFHGGSSADRLSIGTELLRLAQIHGMAPVEVVAHIILMQQALGCLDYPSAERHAVRVERLSERYALGKPGSLVMCYRAFRLSVVGRYDEAERLYRTAARAYSRQSEWRFELGLSYLARYCLGLLKGNLDDLLVEAELVATHWDVTVESYALVLASAGRTDEARKVAGAPRRHRPDYFARLFTVVQGLLGIMIDDRERVLNAYRALAPHPEEIVSYGSGLIPLWPVALVLGDLATYLGRPDEAAGLYRAALDIARRVDSTVWEDAARRGLAGIETPATTWPLSPKNRDIPDV